MQEDTYNQWVAEDWLLDEIEREPDINERLVKMYDYFRLMADYSEEVEGE